MYFKLTKQKSSFAVYRIGLYFALITHFKLCFPFKAILAPAFQTYQLDQLYQSVNPIKISENENVKQPLAGLNIQVVERLLNPFSNNSLISTTEVVIK